MSEASHFSPHGWRSASKTSPLLVLLDTSNLPQIGDSLRKCLGFSFRRLGRGRGIALLYKRQLRLSFSRFSYSLPSAPREPSGLEEILPPRNVKVCRRTYLTRRVTLTFVLRLVSFSSLPVRELSGIGFEGEARRREIRSLHPVIQENRIQGP